MAEQTVDIFGPHAPVSAIRGDKEKKHPEDGLALCLSGGGYRAMLFHVGALWRLNEAGLLRRLKRVSSVSGGSIAAAVLGMQWSKLTFSQDDGIAPNFEQLVADPLRRLARCTIDIPAILSACLVPRWIGRQLARAYDAKLFRGATLRDLPDSPRFVLNASNLQTGALWRFSRPYMADYRVGRVSLPKLSLAVAVAASSAFPPFLSPVYLNLMSFEVERSQWADLHEPPYTSQAVLSDGGVYDNLGLETAWKRYTDILVSDGGKKLGPDPSPWSNWPLQFLRVTALIDNQVRSLRKRQLIGSYGSDQQGWGRKGAYWGIGTNIKKYKLSDVLPCPRKRTLKLAQVATRLAAMNDRLQEQLINWGYAVSDAAIRRHYCQSLSAPSGFPYADASV